MDDARELLVTIGVYSPLVTDFALETGAIPERQYDIASYMRGHFGRQILLLIMRLHADKPPRPERTGETASIATLLDAGEREKIFTPEVAAGFRDRRQQIQANAEFEGIGPTAMKSFRDAEIGHSLHRRSAESDRTLRSSVILDVAHETYELVVAMEARWGERSLDPWYHAYLNKGYRFWERIAGSDADMAEQTADSDGQR